VRRPTYYLHGRRLVYPRETLPSSVRPALGPPPRGRSTSRSASATAGDGGRPGVTALNAGITVPGRVLCRYLVRAGVPTHRGRRRPRSPCCPRSRSRIGPPQYQALPPPWPLHVAAADGLVKSLGTRPAGRNDLYDLSQDPRRGARPRPLAYHARRTSPGAAVPDLDRLVPGVRRRRESGSVSAG